MSRTKQVLIAISARSLALVGCLLLVPLLMKRGDERWIGMPLWAIACGRMTFVGPTLEPLPPGSLPGWISRERLRQRMGMRDAVGTESDATYLANANLFERVILIIRYAWVCLIAGKPNRAGAQIRLFGVRIDAVSMREAVDRIIAAADIASGTPGESRRRMTTVAFVNPDCLNKAITDREYHRLLNNSDLVLPDGSGLRIATRVLNLPLADNVNGTDLFPLLCQHAATAGKRVFLFGGLPGVAAQVAENVSRQYPGLQIVGCLDGYSHNEQPEAVVRSINASNADILLVGMGAPSQEQWLHEHAGSLQVPIGIGVGGLFDYYSGRISRAPLALREAGLEWVWRIIQEPRAKWRRYVFGNPVFLYRVLRERRRRKKALANDSLVATPKGAGQWARKHAKEAAVPSTRHLNVGRRLRRRLAYVAILKRFLDVAVAGGALIALAPLLTIVAALIRLESPGPVFFRQERVGHRGKPFQMLKFRSMYADAEERLAALMAHNESEGGVLFKMKNDPRITRIGRFIRRYSIDELPQILNVLHGEMSIVGPRPALPSEVCQYSAADRKRLQTKPGLTCLWQIGGRSELSFRQQVELDCEYLKRQSVTTDLGIIAKTVPAVIGGEGAY